MVHLQDRFYYLTNNIIPALITNQLPSASYFLMSKRKMSAIPPILTDGKLISDSKIKSELFNSYVAAQQIFKFFYNQSK